MKKKILTVSAILLMVAGNFVSCESKDDDVTIDTSSYFEKMRFETACWQFQFDLYKTNNPQYLKAIVVNYFDLTKDKELIIKRTDDNSNAFDIFNKALNNEIELLGDFEHPEFGGEEGLTGWKTFVHFINQNEAIEVTNIELRNELLKFEEMVVNELSRNNIKF